MQRLNVVNKLLFPAPNPPDYKWDSLPENLLWLPKEKKDFIPCLLLVEPQFG